VNLKVDPKIVQNCIPASFLRYRKNTKFRKRFFSRFLLFPGRPDRRKSSIFIANTIIFAMRPFLKNNAIFYKIMSKVVPSATPKTTRNLKKLIFTTVENYVFFCCSFLYDFVGK